MNDNVVVVWNILFENNRHLLTAYNNAVAEKISKQCSLYNSNWIFRVPPEYLITFTTCKRLDLFSQTLNSIMNHWTDISMVQKWVCVDDNSSNADRKIMRYKYPWIEFYMKTDDEKGHRNSMNILWNKLAELQPKFWIHIEDDFLFYHEDAYITKSVNVLKCAGVSGIKQVVFNPNYAEGIKNHDVKGGCEILLPTLVNGGGKIQLHQHHYNQVNYKNCHYWPHYSFRPSIIDVKTILSLGNYDSENTFFELDYAKKWYENGNQTAFLDRITHKHIGRNTDEINEAVAPNAYQLNNECQFEEGQYINVAGKNVPIKVVNLERRPDRKEQMIKQFAEYEMPEYTFFKAVDGKELIPTQEMYMMFKNNDFANRRGFIGCALTHIKLWNELLGDPVNEYYIILEDDIRINAGLYNNNINNINNINNKIADIFNELSDGFKTKDLVFLGYHIHSHIRNGVSAIYDIPITNPANIAIRECNKKIYIGGTFGYTINKNGAKKLIEYINKNGVKNGIDYVMANHVEGLGIYETQPSLVFSEWLDIDNGINMGNNLSHIDTDIQRDVSTLDFSKLIKCNEEYIFIENKDQIGNDSYRLTGVDNDVYTMMEKCSSDEKVVGFNTLGFFKHTIVELTESAFFRPNVDGIYIKKQIYKKMGRL